MIAYNQQRPTGAFEHLNMHSGMSGGGHYYTHPSQLQAPYHHAAQHRQQHQQQQQQALQYQQAAAAAAYQYKQQQAIQADLEAMMRSQQQVQQQQQRVPLSSTRSSIGTGGSNGYTPPQHYDYEADLQSRFPSSTFRSVSNGSRGEEHRRQSQHGALEATNTINGHAAAAHADHWSQQQPFVQHAQQQHHYAHQLPAPYAHGYAHASELSVPPALPAPHQGAGLQPAFEPAQYGHAYQQAAGYRGYDGFSAAPAAANSATSQADLAFADHYGAALIDAEYVNAQQQQQELDASNAMLSADAHGGMVGQMDHDSLAQQQPQQQQQQLVLQAQMQAQAAASLAAVELPSETSSVVSDELQLIAHDASAIPPPPPIEKSAHPLAALATDLVWEAFLSAASNDGSSPSVPSSGSASPTYHQTHFGSSSRAASLGPAGALDCDFSTEARGNSSPLSEMGVATAHHAGTYGTSGHSAAAGFAPRTPGFGAISAGRLGHSRNNSKSGSGSSPRAYDARCRSVSRDENDGQSAARFGAIGGERKPRHSNLGLTGTTPMSSMQASPATRSDSSSPASTAPGTPANEASLNNSCIVASSGSDSSSGAGGLGEKMVKRFAGGANSHYWDDVDGFTHMQHAHNGGTGGKEMIHSLSQGNKATNNASAGFHQQRFGNLTPPRKLFEQIQKLLGATLLSQQVLLLALYFVAKTPHTSALYPPATSQSALKSTSAPFKLLLAALVVANKHLDDNSFRNSTFSQVANVTLPEVNALEYSMLAGLNFDINVDTFNWLAWLRDLQYQRTTRFTLDYPVNVGLVLSPIIDGVLAHQDQHSREFGSPLAGLAQPELQPIML